MFEQILARTAIGLIRTFAVSEKTQKNMNAFYQREVEPEVQKAKNTLEEKYTECASNAQAFCRQKVEPQLQKAKNTLAEKSNEYSHEFLNSTAVHGSVETVSKFFPPQYKNVFTTIAPPILHVTTKVIGEILPSQKSNTDKTQHTTEKQEEKKKESSISKKITDKVMDESAATAMTETVIGCTKKLTKNLSPTQKFLFTTAICAASHLATKDIRKIMER